MIGFSFTQNNIEYVIVLPSVTYTSGNKVVVGSQELEIYDSTVMASLETAIAAYQPGGSGGDYSQGYADGEAAKESAIASSQAVTANLYKSKLASEDATIAAADATDIDGQGTIFSESYSYLKTSAEMQDVYDDGYDDGETAGYASGYSAGETAGEATGKAAVATSQQPIASDYKSLLSSVDQTIAAADPTTLAGQLSIFSESYQYLSTGGSEWHSDNPLCFEKLSGTGSIRLNTYEFEDFETSFDKINWTRRNDESINLMFSKIYIRCKSIKSGANINLREINSPFTVKISGSLASLCEGSAGKLSQPYELQSLFSNNTTTIADAGDLILHTELTSGCYKNMFYDCRALTKAPDLPATALTYQCYYGMFRNCSSLTKSPVLPDATKFQQCYESMFYGCSALNEIEVEATSWDTWYYSNWVYGVSATGTFTKPSGTTIPTGTNGIPSGWAVVNV